MPTDSVPWKTVEAYLEGPRRRPEDFSADERQRLDEFRTLLAAGTTYLDIDLAMRKQETLQFESVYFEGTDTVGHLFMSYRPPQLPSVDAAGFASFRSVVDRYYENADRMLGRLLEGREGWTVIVVSDHGFASDATRPQTTDSRIGHGAAADWHRRFGLFVISGPGVKRGIRMDQASVYDIAPTILALFHQPVPRSWPGRVLGAVFEPRVFSTAPVRLRADDPVRRGGGEAAVADEQEARELREKLQSLGYLAASDALPMTTSNNRGVGLLAEGKYVEAAAAFREALAEEPNQPTLMVNLGIALRFAGERQEARRLFEKSFPTPDGRRAAGHQLAQLEMDDGNLDEAERILRLVLERERAAAEVRNSLGLVLERRGRSKDAEREYAESARLDPNAAEPRNNLGNIARRERRGADAERWYLAAIAADPYFVGAYNNLALLCQDRGQVDRAIDLYGRALAKSPKNVVVMNNLASLYFSTGETRESRALWRRAVEADPKYTAAEQSRGSRPFGGRQRDRRESPGQGARPGSQLRRCEDQPCADRPPTRRSGGGASRAGDGCERPSRCGNGTNGAGVSRPGGRSTGRGGRRARDGSKGPRRSHGPSERVGGVLHTVERPYPSACRVEAVSRDRPRAAES